MTARTQPAIEMIREWMTKGKGSRTWSLAPPHVLAALSAVEAYLRRKDEALEKAEFTITHDIHGCGPRCYCGRYNTLLAIRAALAATEPVPQQTEEGR